jgi:surfeit locus 1 family protein
VSVAAAVPPRRRLLVQALLALIGCAILLSLGAWQLERRAWKEALIDTLTRRLAAPPEALPEPARWAALDAADADFRRVRFRAAFETGREALVFTSGSSLRPDVSGPGYWVFSPARLDDGSVVVVDRGFVPEGRQDAATRGNDTGPLDIVGVMRWPERPGLFTPSGDPARNTWFARDHTAIAAAKNWGDVAPFYIEQEAPTPAGGLPRAGILVVNLPNNHLQYAITWFGLAAALVVVFAIFARAQWRARARPSDPVQLA